MRRGKMKLTVSVSDGVSSIGSIIDGIGFVFVSKFVSLVMFFEWLFWFLVCLYLLDPMPCVSPFV